MEAAFATWMTWDELSGIGLNEPVVGASLAAPTSPETAVRLDPEWALLFTMMKLLAQHFGAANVRLVAWFSH
jgi:hypothetical protein